MAARMASPPPVINVSDQASTTAPPGALSKRKVIGWAVLLLVPTLGIGYAVGVLAEPGATWFANITQRGQFAWTTGSVAAAAVAVVLLAAFTAALAWATSGNVSATWQLAELARRDQASRDRPVIVVTRIVTDQPAAHSGGPGTSQVEVRALLRNIGAGSAVEVRATVTYAGEGSTEPAEGTAFYPVLAPADGLAEIRHVFHRPSDHPADWYDGEHFEVAGSYRDARGAGSYPIVHPGDDAPDEPG